jgi:hypothetical protein
MIAFPQPNQLHDLSVSDRRKTIREEPPDTF